VLHIATRVLTSSDFSPKLADALMKSRLDAAFMRPERHAGGLIYRRVHTEPRSTSLLRLAEKRQQALAAIAAGRRFAPWEP
jgi:hypothetical protein